MKRKIEKDGKSLLLAYDHGLEHGPEDFNLENTDPNYVLDIAEEGPFTGVVLGKGVAEKYYSSYNVPLVLKLNGKTSLDPKNYSCLNCSVHRAIEIGADALGYTIYPGSKYEDRLQEMFHSIQQDAREYNIPIIVWSYPRGEGINENETDTVAYAARIALELGADYTKVKYTGSKESFEWVVENAGKAKVLCSGGSRKPDEEIFEQIRAVMEAGASGLAIGRNVWKRENPLEFAEKIEEIIFEG